MSNYNPITNFIGTDGIDLGKKLITKDYLLDVYQNLLPQIGITPELWVWGRKTYIGTNSAGGFTSTPVTTFSGGSNWRQVSIGGNSTNANGLAIKTDGTLWTWGANQNFLGLNLSTGVTQLTPTTTFSGGTNWRQVSSGFRMNSAIKTDGTLWTWGYGVQGALGNATFTNTCITPITTFTGGTDWKQVSCGDRFVAAIKTDGTLWTWGRNPNGQLGNNSTINVSTPITTFAGGTGWEQVSCAEFSAAAIKTDGTLWVWGSGFQGQLGNGITSAASSTPVTTFAGGTNWKQVSANGANVLAIKTDGTLWAWGGNGSLSLGINAGGVRSTPVTTFAGGTNWKQVSCGESEHAAAIKTDGSLWIWGRNTDGPLGNATTNTIGTPITTFAGGTNWKQVSCAGYNTAAIESSNFI